MKSKVLAFGALASLLVAVPGGTAPPAPAVPASAPAPTQVKGPEARALILKGALLLDVRTPAEFQTGHPEGALNVPVDQLPQALANMPKDRPIVVYCASGIRSARATAFLRSQKLDARDLGALRNW